MIPIIQAFLAGHWKAVAVAALVAVLGVQSLRLENAKADLVTAKAKVAAAEAALTNPATRHTWQADFTRADRDLRSCNNNLASTTGALNRQSLAVKALQAEAERRQRESAAALQDARRATTTARRAADAILLRRAGPDVCADALALIREP